MTSRSGTLSCVCSGCERGVGAQLRNALVVPHVLCGKGIAVARLGDFLGAVLRRLSGDAGAGDQG